MIAENLIYLPLNSKIEKWCHRLSMDKMYQKYYQSLKTIVFIYNLEIEKYDTSLLPLMELKYQQYRQQFEQLQQELNKYQLELLKLDIHNIKSPTKPEKTAKEYNIWLNDVNKSNLEYWNQQRKQIEEYNAFLKEKISIKQITDKCNQIKQQLKQIESLQQDLLKEILYHQIIEKQQKKYQLEIDKIKQIILSIKEIGNLQ